MPKRRPRPSQTLPKWSPKPFQIQLSMHFLGIYFDFQICIHFSSIFDRFSIRKLSLQPLILLISSRENAIFYKIAIFDHNIQNHRKTLPKSFQNPPQIHPKSMKNKKKSIKKAIMTQEASKMQKKCEKLRKMTQHGSKTLPT